MPPPRRHERNALNVLEQAGGGINLAEAGHAFEEATKKMERRRSINAPVTHEEKKAAAKEK